MSVSQKWISQNSTKGGLFGSAEGRIPEEGGGGVGGGDRLSPLNPLLYKYLVIVYIWNGF